MPPQPSTKLVSLELIGEYKAKIYSETFKHPTYGKLSWNISQMNIGINGRKRWYAVAVDDNRNHRHNYVEPERAEPLSHLELAQILTSNGNEGLKNNPDWPTWFYDQSYSGLRDSIQNAWKSYRPLVEEHRSAPSRHSTPDIVLEVGQQDYSRLLEYSEEVPPETLEASNKGNGDEAIGQDTQTLGTYPTYFMEDPEIATDFLFNAVPTDSEQPENWSPALDEVAPMAGLQAQDKILPSEPTEDPDTSMTACDGENCLATGPRPEWQAEPLKASIAKRDCYEEWTERGDLVTIRWELRLKYENMSLPRRVKDVVFALVQIIQVLSGQTRVSTTIKELPASIFRNFFGRSLFKYPKWIIRELEQFDFVEKDQICNILTGNIMAPGQERGNHSSFSQLSVSHPEYTGNPSTVSNSNSDDEEPLLSNSITPSSLQAMERCSVLSGNRPVSPDYPGFEFCPTDILTRR